MTRRKKKPIASAKLNSFEQTILKIKNLAPKTKFPNVITLLSLSYRLLDVISQCEIEWNSCWLFY
jgi:hypothetical protein